jgi:hypothetical protein
MVVGEVRELVEDLVVYSEGHLVPVVCLMEDLGSH